MVFQNDFYGKTVLLEIDDMMGVCYFYFDGGIFKCNNDL